MSKRFKFLAIIGVAGSLFVAGCGGDDDESEDAQPVAEDVGASGASGASGETGAAGLLPAEFVREADAVCTDGDAVIDDAAKKLFGNPNKEPSKADQVAFVEDTVLPGIQTQLDRLGALDSPETGVEEYETFLSNAQEVLDELKDDPGAIVNDQNADPFAAVEKQAAELGLKECAQD